MQNVLFDVVEEFFLEQGVEVMLVVDVVVRVGFFVGVVYYYFCDKKVLFYGFFDCMIEFFYEIGRQVVDLQCWEGVCIFDILCGYLEFYFELVCE